VRKHLLIFLPLVALLLMASIIRGVQQAGLTAGGPTQDFPTAGHSSFSTAQPVKAGLFFLAPSTAAGTTLDHARMSIGFTDGTNQRCVSVRSRDAQGVNSDTVRQAFTNQLAWIYAASTTNAASAMALSSISNDRITGTYGTLMPAAWLVNAILFGGSDCEAFVGDFALNASDGGTTVVDSTSHSGFTFGWDLVFFVSRIASFNGTSTTHAILSFGVAIWDGSAISQGCVSWSNQNGVGTEVSSVELNDQRCAHGHVMPSSGGDECEITARNGSGGLTATTRGANASGYSIGFLALRLGNISGIKLFSRDTLTSTGSDAWTDAGHSPQFMLSMSSSATAMNTLSSGAADACMGIGAACGDSGSHEEFSSAIMADDGATTSDTKCVTHNVFHHIPDQSGGTPVTADLTSIQHNGATLNYSAVQGTARKQLILSVGRNIVHGTAMSVGGSAPRSTSQVSHGGRAREAAGAAEQAKPMSAKSGRARAHAGTVEQSKPAVSKGARANSAAGAVEHGVAKVTHSGITSGVAGAVESAQASSAKGAQAAVPAGAVSYGQATVISVGQVSGFSVAGAVSRASATVTHGANARAVACEVGDAAGQVSHAGRASAAPGEVSSANATSAKGARARSACSADAQAAGRVAHGASAKAAAGAASRATGKKTAGAQAHAAAGSAPRAQASVISAGQVSGFSVAGAVSRATAKVSHGASARDEAGAPDNAAGSVSHRGKAAAHAGEVAKPAGRKIAGGRARDASGAVEGATGKVSHGAQAVNTSRGGSRAAGKVAHAGRASAVGGTGGTVILNPIELLGFYARTSRTVRSRLIAVAGALQIQHENLRFTEPTGTWAKARVYFDEITDAEYGSGKVSYLVPGTLEIEIRTRLREGKKALLEQAEALAADLQIRELSGVVYAAAALRPARDSGDDEFSAKLTVPFRAWDSAFPRVAGALPDGDDYSDAERAVRSRFATELPDVAVSYDNLPPTTGATWVRLSVNEQEGFDAGGTRRTVGVMEASIHAPALTGTKASLRLADRIVETFRAVDVGGVVFDLPYLQRGRQVAGEWVLPVFCPWSCDHA